MKVFIQRLLKVSIISTSLTCLTAVSFAQTPTPQQIEQFKRLPPSEQQALARSLGINPNDLGFNIGSNAPKPQQEPVSGDRRILRRDISDQTDNDETSSELLDEDQAPDTLDEKLQLFGYDIFNYGAENFTPTEDIPIPANYVLGPGDTLVIQLYGKENSSHSLTLDREGQIQFPTIGPVSIAGISFDAAKAKIKDIVQEQMIGVKSSVTLGQLRTIRIFVLGEAQIPGSYVVGSLSTMTNALLASGGITEIGSLRNVQLKRSGKTITTLDLYDLLLKGDTSNDSRLLPGDVIFIPPIGKTTGISGAVKRPAIYELKQESNVADLIDLAGGLLPTAFVPASRIERITKSGEKTLVNIDISRPEGQNFKVNDADIIQIFSTLETMQDIVSLDGHVKRPGGFAWRENMRFTDIIPNADALLPNPDIVVGLIQREEKITRKIQIFLFSPQDAFLAPKSNSDPKLNPRDIVTLFEYNTDRTTILTDLVDQLKIQSSFNQRQQTLQVYGSVRFPGEYPLASDTMRARDLINLAGGLTESAQGSGAEITRYDISANRERVDLRKDFDLTNENPVLKAGDTLRIKQIPLWQNRESVEIIGEVIYPGIYDLLPGETLLSVIERAGGLTPYAYPEGAIFSREELRSLEQDRLENLKIKIESDIVAANIEQSNNSKEIDEAATNKILRSIERTEALGRMVIDLPAIIQEQTKFDFELADGDKLEIPRFKPSVTVVGEIQHSTSHFYNDRLSIKDYISMSGGTKQNADKSRIYVVRANGSVYTPPKRSIWFAAGSNALEPGDTIVVPIDTDKVDPITFWSSITTIMSQAALGIAAFASL